MSGMWRRNAGVEAEVLFEGEGEEAAGELEGPDVAVLDQSLRAISGADTEEGQVVPPGKGLKVPAGVRNAIDLVERVREVGDARHMAVAASQVSDS